MAQLSIRVGSPAVCSPVSCFAAIKYHRGSAKEGQMRVWREKSHKAGRKNTFTGGNHKAEGSVRACARVERRDGRGREETEVRRGR